MNSSRHFMRELNRLGLTSLVDAGGGSQIYPDDYAIIEELHKRGEMTVRMAYNIFTQKPKEEKEDFLRSMKLMAPGKGDDFYRCNGAGEMLVYSAADFEDFMEPRPDFPPNLEKDLKEVVLLLAAKKWPFRIHATYDESISRMLNVFEQVNRAKAAASSGNRAAWPAVVRNSITRLRPSANPKSRSRRSNAT